MAAEVVGEVFEKVIRDGIKYLVKKTVNAVGKKIKEFFRDEDDDGVPDTEKPEFTEDDDEEETSREEETSEPDTPTRPPANTSEPSLTVGDIVVITPDGPMIIYANSDDEHYSELVSDANEQWLEMYGATQKPFGNYSVSEALLFIIAGCALFGLFRKIFGRRKL